MMRWFRRLFQQAQMDERDKRFLAAALILAASPRNSIAPDGLIQKRVKVAIIEADELLLWLAESERPDSEVLFE